MVETTSDGGSTTSDGSNTGSGSGGIVDFLTSPIGMALAGGVAITLVAGYLVF